MPCGVTALGFVDSLVDVRVRGKSRGVERRYPLVCQLLDSAAVAGVLWDRVLTDSARRGLAAAAGAEEAASAASDQPVTGLHVGGKVIPGFQGLVPDNYAELLRGLGGSSTGTGVVPLLNMAHCGYGFFPFCCRSACRPGRRGARPGRAVFGRSFGAGECGAQASLGRRAHGPRDMGAVGAPAFGADRWPGVERHGGRGSSGGRRCAAVAGRRRVAGRVRRGYVAGG
ncbi:HD domain-containing protein [Streptomyces sp. bgisy084]|uniref:HD domain-containing protein n=1 Tax=Streptomyces sp. bgisy084 TaxID=3413777 RepID=UPI003D73F1FC